MVTAALLGGLGVHAADAAPAPAVHRLEHLLAYEPAWLDAGSRLVFFGNRRQGEPVELYGWEPASGKLGRLTAAPAMRHSLTVHDGRAAFVERSNEPVAVEATQTPADQAVHMPQPGPETVMIQRPGSRVFEPAFKGWVLADTLRWSPDGERLALVTMDRTGAHRLALLKPGQPLTMVALDQAYEVHALVGWRGASDVLLRVTPVAGGPTRLLLVGKSGIHPTYDGEGARLSEDGQWLLQRASASGGVYMRALNGAGRSLHASASAYAWSPEGDRVYAAVQRDLLALDRVGKVMRRWNGVARLAVGDIRVSPDGSRLAFSQDFHLAVITLGR